MALQIPVGVGPPHAQDPFRGIIDLIEMQMLVFDDQTDGRDVQVLDIPENRRDAAELWRDAMLEKLYAHSDELMELALSEEEIPADLIRKIVRQATVHQQIQPVLCGSALHGIGVQPILDAVALYLPSPPRRRRSAARTRRKRTSWNAASPTPQSPSVAWCSRSCRPRQAIFPGSASILAN